MNKLYFLTQGIHNGPRSYVCAVVSAPDEESAKHIHPNGSMWDDDNDEGEGRPDTEEWTYSDWAYPSQVNAQEIGISTVEIGREVVVNNYRFF
jgi:hypothetical protein